MPRHDRNASARIDEVIGGLYDTALDDSLWPEVLRKIEELVRGSNMHLLVTNSDTRLPTFGIVSRYPEANEEYVQHYASIDERWPRILALPHATPASNELLFSGNEIRGSPTYNEFLVKYDAQRQIITRMDGLDSASIVFAAIRERRRGPFDGEEIKIFRCLLPHVLRAVQIRQTLVSSELVNTSLKGFLECLSLGVILIDQSGRILECNAPAKSILNQGDGLLSERDTIRACHGTENAALQSAIGAVVSQAQGVDADTDAESVLAITRPSLRRRWLLQVVPLNADGLDFGARRAVAAILVRDPEAGSTPVPDVLQSLYHLTPAEARLTAALAIGLSLRDYAEQAAITMNTARWTLKHVFAKTETKSQTELIRLLLRVPLALLR